MGVDEAAFGFFLGFAGWHSVKALWAMHPRNIRIKKPKFIVEVEHRFDYGDSGLLVWVKRTRGNSFPGWANHQRKWRDETYGDEDFRIIDFIPNSDPDAEEKVIDAILKAKQLAKDWELPYPMEIEELALTAQRAIER